MQVNQDLHDDAADSCWIFSLKSFEVARQCIDQNCHCPSIGILYQLPRELPNMHKTVRCKWKGVRGELDVPLLIRFPDGSKQAAK